MKQHFIKGEWVTGASGETLPVLDPSTGEVFDQLQRGNAADIDRAVAAARAAATARSTSAALPRGS